MPGPSRSANSGRRPRRLAADGARALAELNRRHLAAPRRRDPALAARIRTFETAFGMQTEMPEVFDLSGETDATLALYGLQRGSTEGFAWQCLVARRLAERGVRFIELIDSGASNNWDAHGDMIDRMPRWPSNVDRPIAGLLTDLKRRGMLDDTLVVWTTEFGRTPFNNSAAAAGREHHHWAFSSWLAGGGVKAGLAYGEHGRLRHPRRRASRPCPRLPRHDPAPAGPRPHPADLPTCGPRLPADRRTRRGGGGGHPVTDCPDAGYLSLVRWNRKMPCSALELLRNRRRESLY